MASETIRWQLGRNAQILKSQNEIQLVKIPNAVCLFSQGFQKLQRQVQCEEASSSRVTHMFGPGVCMFILILFPRHFPGRLLSFPALSSFTRFRRGVKSRSPPGFRPEAFPSSLG